MNETIFDQVKKYHLMGLYKEEQVKEFVVKGKLTKTQYKEITGKQYKVTTSGAKKKS